MKRIAATLQQQSDGHPSAQKDEHTSPSEAGQGSSSTAASDGAGGGGDTTASPELNGAEACPSSFKGDGTLGVGVDR